MGEKFWTESEVYDRLRHVFPPPAHVILPQVRNGTGYARAQDRTADAVVLSVWPSRGLWIAGVEIKCHRSDWKKELANPAKAASIQGYCSYWYVASPVDVVPLAEVPKTWGAITVGANTAKIVKSAPEQPTQAPDMLLLCSILRTAAEYTVPAASVKHQINKAVASARKTWESLRQRELEDATRTIENFEKASGVCLESRWDAGDIGKAVRFVQETGLLRARNFAEELRSSALACVKRLDGALEKLESSKDETGDRAAQAAGEREF